MFSGGRLTWPLYLLSLLYAAAVLLAWFSVWNPSWISRPLTGLLLGPAALFAAIVLNKEDPDKRYFKLCYVPLPLIVVLQAVRAQTIGAHPDDIRAIPMALTAFAAWSCSRRDNHHFANPFLGWGIVLLIVWCSSLAFRTLLRAVALNVDTLLETIKLDAFFFTWLVCFLVAGYTRLGLLREPATHLKVWVIVATLLLFSVVAAFPEFGGIVRVLPFGEKLPNLAGVGLLAVGPGIGIALVLRK